MVETLLDDWMDFTGLENVVAVGVLRVKKNFLTTSGSNDCYVDLFHSSQIDMK